jgi:C-terminal processing protease CtpA/Prc
LKRNPYLALFILLGTGACSVSDDSGSVAPQVGTDACSNDGQKQFVLDVMRDVYYWNDLLPANVDLDAYTTPETLLEHLKSFQPLDDFSYIDVAASDARFFGEGQYEGYGFSSRLEAPGDLRFVRVFDSSPAADAGFERGERILMLNGRTIADIEANEGLDALFSLPTLDFTIRRLDDSEDTFSIGQGLVTINPLPQFRTIDLSGGTTVGYLELVTFIGTADAAFAEVFNMFKQASVTDVIIDLRYNGGGLVSTTELLGNYLGGAVATDPVFSKTLFNANNSIFNRIALFEELLESISLSRLVVIATDRTASASELITNSMESHVDVSIVGSVTRGKPVGQLGIPFCEKILRPTAFETVNADDEGGYFGGLPVDCPAQDDVLIPIGNDADPNMTTALFLLENGACPPPPTAQGMQKIAPERDAIRSHPGGPAWQRLAGAW